MTTKRTGEPWMTPPEYGRTLVGLSLNLIVREVRRSVPFYTEVLGFRALHHDVNFAALERDGARIQLHADHTYDHQPWAPRLAADGRRGLGAEIRLMGLDPDDTERRARAAGHTVLLGAKDWPHGWRDCVLEDPDGYTFAVGVPLG
ncbi:MAG TPA: VOC family protein [Candidatus Limnocylindria bacterium]|nr:VOC family protein [Candidatus Limnocylindria bacterium]